MSELQSASNHFQSITLDSQGWMPGSPLDPLLPNHQQPAALPWVAGGIASASDRVYDYTLIPFTDHYTVTSGVGQPDPARHDPFLDSLTGTPLDAAFVQAEQATTNDFTATTNDWIRQTFSSGVFTVGASGQVRIDYLYDGGAYEGELAVFSLEGLETVAPGSLAFMREAARRALSNSHLGAVVIRDGTEAARFSGAFPGDKDVNAGSYKGVKTVMMQPGTRFGFMLVPNGTVAEVFEQPKQSGAKRPLFSLETANPNQAFHVGQIGDVTGGGHTFAFEDLRLDRRSDRDYNDVIVQVQGASGQAPSLDQLIAPRKDWRTTRLGRQLLDYAAAHARPDSQQPLIGIIDTGFAAAHPDLNHERIMLGPDYLDGDGNPLLQPGEGNPHGTHILGIIAATRTNGMSLNGLNDAAPIWLSRDLAQSRGGVGPVG